MHKKVSVQDNFLDKDYFLYLQDQVLSPLFPWTISTVHEQELSTDDFMMCHGVCKTENGFLVVQSTIYNELERLFEKMGVFICIRAKINLTQQQQTPLEHPLHIDCLQAPTEMLTSILYFNTNNGYTRFADGTITESKENRLVTFPNNMLHGGAVNTCDVPFRVAMNISWIKNKDNTDA